MTIHAELHEESARATYLEFLGRFLQTRAGPGLDTAMAALPPQERLALDTLKSVMESPAPH